MQRFASKLWYALNFGLPEGWRNARGRREPLSKQEQQLLRAKTLHGIAINRSLNVRLPKPRYRYKLRTCILMRKRNKPMLPLRQVVWK